MRNSKKMHSEFTLSLLVIGVLVLFPGLLATTNAGASSLNVSGYHTVEANGCWLSGLGGTFGRSDLLPSTGNFQIDSVFQREGIALVNIFQVRPWGYFFNDSNGPNAYASPEVTNAAYGPDGTVVFGMTLLRGELARDLGYGFSVPAILAHEFTHIVQFKRHSSLNTMQRELQADYMAGWYMGRRGTWVLTDVRPAFQSFFEKGDYDFNNPSHHGTPQQRLAAISSGFVDASLPLDQVYRRSADFVAGRATSSRVDPTPRVRSSGDSSSDSNERTSASDRENKIQECMAGMPERCIDTCLHSYNLPYAVCKSQACRPEDPTNQRSWRRACERRVGG